MVEYFAIAGSAIIARYIYKKNEEKIKGRRGERKLARSLKKLKLPGKTRVFRDCLLPTEWGSSQIDALAITRFGIIVCEMKNYSGRVFGAVGQSSWQVLYGDKHIPLYSPVKQNNSHVSALIHLLKSTYPNIRILPISVFSNQAELHIQNSRNKVCNLKDLHKVVCRQLGSEALSDQQIEEIAAVLEHHQLKSRRARRNHITAIQLKQDAMESYSPSDIQSIKQEILEQAKDKPLISSSTGRLPCSSSDKPVMSSGRPLFEILEELSQKPDGANNHHNHQPDKSHPGPIVH